MYSARLSQSPYPYTGNVKIETISNIEQYQFYITGTALAMLDFSDNISYNAGDLNNIFGPKTVADMSALLADILIDYNCHRLSTAIGTHSFVDDPLFTDPHAWDFTLQSGSPVKGKGDASSEIPYDINWDPRDTDTPSLGAFE